MRVLLWCCRISIFLFFLAFALKNVEPVSVSFFFETSWHAPLIIVVLAFFAAGVVLGLLALVGTVFGLRREVSRLKRQAQAQAQALTVQGDAPEASVIVPMTPIT